MAIAKASKDLSAALLRTIQNAVEHFQAVAAVREGLAQHFVPAVSTFVAKDVAKILSAFSAPLEKVCRRDPEDAVGYAPAKCACRARIYACRQGDVHEPKSGYFKETSSICRRRRRHHRHPW